MDGRVREVNSALKRAGHESLYVIRDNAGCLLVMERHRAAVTIDCGTYHLTSFVDQPRFIMPFTHNWQSGGRPVEWGIEPLMHRLQFIQRDDYEEYCKMRDERERVAKRSARNEYMARAADMRRDFGKALSDINTSAMDKSSKADNRYKEDIKYGNSG